MGIQHVLPVSGSWSAAMHGDGIVVTSMAPSFLDRASVLWQQHVLSLAGAAPAAVVAGEVWVTVASVPTVAVEGVSRPPLAWILAAGFSLT